MKPSILIAGIGNVFLGDDGFGVEVAQRLTEVELPRWARVGDYGTSGMQLAFDLLDGYATTILIDAVPRGERPGTLCVLEIDAQNRREQPENDGPADVPNFDAHGINPQAVLDLLGLLGGDVGRVLVLGCEPTDVGERLGLSDPVRAAVPDAVRKIEELAREESHRLAQQAIASRFSMTAPIWRRSM